MTKNDIVNLKIDGYASGGDGVAHHDGRAVFVRHALKGEVVEARILKATNTAVFAKVERVLEASPERLEPDCPHFGKCGGCALRHMTYEEELRYKRERVSDALRKLGGVEFDLPEVVASPQVDAYRNKAIFEVAVRGGEAVIGFYREHSHEIVPIEACPIQSGAANDVAAVLRDWVRETKLNDGSIRGLFVREGVGGLQIALVTPNKKLPNLAEFCKKLQERVKIMQLATITQKDPSNVALSGEIRTFFGKEYLEDTLGGLKFRLSPRAFYQVNRPQAERLYAEAVKYAALADGGTALDLYCGAGTITLALARSAPETARVIGAEIVADAVKNAIENAKLNGVSNAEFILADAAEVTATADVVVVDPPRKGLAAEVIDAIAAMSPKRVVYVSCDPATLARDVKLFAARGFSFKTARAFDMFPRCAHVETVVLLEGKK